MRTSSAGSLRQADSEVEMDEYLDSGSDYSDSNADARSDTNSSQHGRNGSARAAAGSLIERIQSVQHLDHYRSKRKLELEQQKALSTLHLIQDANPKSDDAKWWDWHRSYTWLCSPYQDHWLPWPSKSTLHKTLNRFDFNAYNPFDMFGDFYRPYWSRMGLLISLGCVALLVIYSIFAIADHVDDNRQQQDSFVLLDTTSLESVAYPVAFAFVQSDGSALLYNESYFTVEWTQRTYSSGELVSETDMGVLPCVVVDQPAICPGTDVSLQGLSGSDTFITTHVTVRACNQTTAATFGNFTTTCVSDAERERVLEDGWFTFRAEMSVAGGVPSNLMEDPSFNTTRTWPHRPNYKQTPEVFFRKVENRFPSRALRDTRYIRYVQFSHAENFVSEYDASSGELFELVLRLDASQRKSTFVGRTILDMAASIGGVFMLCYVLITIFSRVIVRQAFLQSRKFIVDPDTVRTIILKKEAELREFKEDLVMMRTYQALRISEEELYGYLNSKRDAELTTFKSAMFDSLNTKHTDEVVREEWNASVAPKKLKVPEALRRKRNDELQTLVRVDQVHRMDDPELAKMINILAMRELRRQSDELLKFVRSLKDVN